MKCVYVIENLITKNKYVGSAVDFERRKKQHLTMLRKETHFNKWLQREYKETEGKITITPLIVCPNTATSKDVRDLEQGCINTGDYVYNRAKYTSRSNSEGRLVNILKRKKQRNYMKRFAKHIKAAAVQKTKDIERKEKFEASPKYRKRNKETGEWEYIALS